MGNKVVIFLALAISAQATYIFLHIITGQIDYINMFGRVGLSMLPQFGAWLVLWMICHAVNKCLVLRDSKDMFFEVASYLSLNIAVFFGLVFFSYSVAGIPDGPDLAFVSKVMAFPVYIGGVVGGLIKITNEALGSNTRSFVVQKQRDGNEK